MGIIDSGPLGPFRKKIGPAIGRRHMGQDLVLPLYHKTTKPATESQILQRQKFASILAFLSPLKPLVNLGFKAFAKKKSAVNAAFSYNFDSAFVFDGDQLEINYPKMVISRGQITPPNGLHLSSQPNRIIFNWSEEPQSKYCQVTDRGSFVTYDPVTDSFVFELDAVERKNLTFEMNMEPRFSGQTLHCWVVFTSADGKIRGDSKYAGTVIA